MSNEERFVIFASTLGTVFEWYDFFLYAVLAPFFASLFFPPGNDTAALLSAFATYAAGFLVRPFGAMLFGRVGDIVGRKWSFLVTITLMGSATFLVGFLPTFATIGWGAPMLLVALRLIQGIAVGGEAGGAITYVAEHARPAERGFATSWLQTCGTLGLALALVVIILCREFIEAGAFSEWGWRIPFIVSVILLVFAVYIRLRLNETPSFLRMKEEGKCSRAPLTESFLRYPNNKYVLLALLPSAGQAVVWYTGQFYALFFLTITLKMNYLPAYLMVLVSLIIATPVYVLFGWLSDRIGRLKIILAGLVIAALTYFPLFAALTHYVNPDLEAFARRTPIVLTADELTCRIHVFVTPFTTFSTCDRAKDFVTKLGLSFKSENAAGMGEKVALVIGANNIEGFDADQWNGAFLDAGYPNLVRNVDGRIVSKPADLSKVGWVVTELILIVMVSYAAMIYGASAAFMAEMFPTRLRYTSLSLPFHIGAGWFGGMLPLLATAFVAANGDIYVGLWYPIAVALMTAALGFLFLRDTKDIDIVSEGAWKV
jgi:MFS family permease